MEPLLPQNVLHQTGSFSSLRVSDEVKRFTCCDVLLSGYSLLLDVRFTGIKGKPPGLAWVSLICRGQHVFFFLGWVLYIQYNRWRKSGTFMLLSHLTDLKHDHKNEGNHICKICWPFLGGLGFWLIKSHCWFHCTEAMSWLCLHPERSTSPKKWPRDILDSHMPH